MVDVKNNYVHNVLIMQLHSLCNKRTRNAVLLLVVVMMVDVI